jgi:hypothetical protein
LGNRGRLFPCKIKGFSAFGKFLNFFVANRHEIGQVSHMSNSTTARRTAKTTKSQLREAVDSFLWLYRDLTGGTSEEVRNQAPRGYLSLTAKAELVAKLASNPNKAAAADSHLMEYATTLIPARVRSYAERYLPTAEQKSPANVIPFRSVA